LAGDAYEHEQWLLQAFGPHGARRLVEVSVGYLARLGDGSEHL
jgi:hypothetical protein